MPSRKKAVADAAKGTEDPGGTTTGKANSGVVDPRRRRLLTPSVPALGKPAQGKGVLYWMSRDQRVQDNWALLHARDLAMELGGELRVAFALVPKFLEATIRHFEFMLRGLEEVEQELHDLSIPFDLLTCSYGEHATVLAAFCACQAVGTVVLDMSPLRVPRAWSSEVAAALEKEGICCIQVDAHNVVPVWQASDKQEHAARTIRKKITGQYGHFLKDIPTLGAMHGQSPGPKVDWEAARASLEVDRTVLPVAGVEPGSKAALHQLHSFCKERLAVFADKRNDPNINALSGLSPYLHFGQISAQRCALTVRSYAESPPASVEPAVASCLVRGSECFLEEAVVRRELSDNFCWYQEKYDSLDAAAGWAIDTLMTHQADKREYTYVGEELEASKTHDDLWNAAQRQLVTQGKMHGFLRMYWAKKILEWTETPQEALRIAIWLNDRYSLDGRDPNGYVGIMWSICGIHDMGWTERPIFGKIRFMNYAGCKRKFDVSSFERKFAASGAVAESGAAKNAKAVKKARIK